MSTKTKVLLLGCYHFSNPSADSFNLTVDDYLSEKRQKEILDVVLSLSKFSPQKIFIESCIKWNDEANEMYSKFKKNEFDINQKATVGEKFQIGLRLAKHLNLDSIYGVDAAGKWFYDKVKVYADSIGTDILKINEDQTKAYIYNLQSYFSTHTVKENLYYLNNPEELLNNNHSVYNNVFPKIGAGDNYLGAELVGEWYKRNAKIYGNILKYVTPIDKAILIIYGSGHIHILNQFFNDNPNFEVIDVRKYLK